MKYTKQERKAFKKNRDDLNSQLFKASQDNNLTLVKSLLLSTDKTKADIHYNDDIAFRISSIKGHLNIIKFLLTDSKLNSHSNISANKNQAFKGACMNGHLPVVEYVLNLMKNNSDINELKNFGAISAVSAGRTNVVKYFCQQIDPFFDSGILLRTACKKQHVDIINYFLYELNQPVNLSLKDKMQQTFEPDIFKHVMMLVNKRDLFMLINEQLEDKDEISKKHKI